MSMGSGFLPQFSNILKVANVCTIIFRYPTSHSEIFRQRNFFRILSITRDFKLESSERLCKLSKNNTTPSFD